MTNSGRRAKDDPIGEAAIGAVLKTRKLKAVNRLGKRIGPASNHAAEYTALIEGLRMARQRGVDHIRVFLDSELVVDQLHGISRVKNAALIPLHEEACDVAEEFASLRLSWVPREMNKEADDEARRALGAP
ncbi:MAG: ribonuclease HI family protein [Actinomycetota bacterium]